MKRLRGWAFTVFGLVVFLLYSGTAYSQSITENTGIVVNSNDNNLPMLNFFVIDADSNEFLSGVVISVTHKSKTYHTQSNYGFASLVNKFKKDTITVSAHLMGYEDISARFPLQTRLPRITISMKATKDTLASLVFSDNAIFMVSRGDTVIYNVNLFETKKGDEFKTVLMRLPGISIEDGRILHNGKPISKILVNGTTLFGNNLDAAMTLLYADEVTQVKVFDEHDRDRLVEADTLGPKQRVLDVKTKEPKTKVSSIYLAATAGAFLDEVSDKKDQTIYKGAAKYRRFELDKPRYTAAVNYSKNLMESGYVSNTPLSLGNASLNFERTRARNDNLNARLDLSLKDDSAFNSSSKEYLQGEGQDERVDNHSSLSDNKARGISLNTMYKKSLGGNYIINSQAKLDFRANHRYSGNGSIVSVGGYPVRNQYMNNAISGEEAKGLFSLSFSSATGPEGKSSTRSYGIRAQYEGGYSEGTENRADTVDLLSPVRMLSALNRKEHKPQFVASYTKYLSRKSFLYFNASSSLLFSENQSLADDLVKERIDSVNTMDYKELRMNNSLKIHFDHGNTNDPFYISAGLVLVDEKLTLTDRFPISIDQDCRLFSAFPSLSTGFSKGNSTLKLKYEENRSLPSAMELRDWLDNRSTIYLRSGNPDLKPQYQRIIDVRYDLMLLPINTNLSILTKYTHTTDFISNSTNTLLKDTFYHNFWAKAGSILSKPVNAGTSRDASLTLQAGSYIPAFKLNLTPVLSFKAGDFPYINMDVKHMNSYIGGSASLSTVLYTSKVMLNCFYSYDCSRMFSDGKKRYDTGTHSVSSNFTYFINDGLFLSATGRYVNTSTDVDFSLSILDVEGSLGYKFGPNNAYCLELCFTDIFNDNKFRNIALMDDYIYISETSTLGRAAMIKLVFDLR